MIVLSVFNGFSSLVTSTLTEFDPHLRLVIRSQNAFKQIDSLTNVLNNLGDIRSFSPYVEGKAILLNNNIYEILDLKGIDQTKIDSSWGVQKKILFGKYDLTTEPGINKIIIGLPIALRLSLREGDTVTVTSASNISESISGFTIPKTLKFLVTGIFQTNNKEYDFGIVFCNLKTAQIMLGLKNNVTGYEIRLKDIDDSENVKKYLEALFSENDFSIYTWFDLHKDLYTVMLIERWAAFIILCLIIAVAVFNILGSLTMTVLEKRKDIAVLRSMGIKEKSILKIFMFEGLLIGIIGTLIGTMIGLFVCYLQIKYNFYPLDASKYIIDALPVEIRITDILAIVFMSLFLSFFASLYPAKRALKTNIIEAIKWE